MGGRRRRSPSSSSSSSSRSPPRRSRSRGGRSPPPDRRDSRDATSRTSGRSGKGGPDRSKSYSPAPDKGRRRRGSSDRTPWKGRGGRRDGSRSPHRSRDRSRNRSPGRGKRRGSDKDDQGRVRSEEKKVAKGEERKKSPINKSNDGKNKDPTSESDKGQQNEPSKEKSTAGDKSRKDQTAKRSESLSISQSSEKPPTEPSEMSPKSDPSAIGGTSTSPEQPRSREGEASLSVSTKADEAPASASPGASDSSSALSPSSATTESKSMTSSSTMATSISLSSSSSSNEAPKEEMKTKDKVDDQGVKPSDSDEMALMESEMNEMEDTTTASQAPESSPTKPVDDPADKSSSLHDDERPVAKPTPPQPTPPGRAVAPSDDDMELDVDDEAPPSAKLEVLSPPKAPTGESSAAPSVFVESSPPTSARSPNSAKWDRKPPGVEGSEVGSPTNVKVVTDEQVDDSDAKATEQPRDAKECEEKPKGKSDEVKEDNKDGHGEREGSRDRGRAKMGRMRSSPMWNDRRGEGDVASAGRGFRGDEGERVGRKRPKPDHGESREGGNTPWWLKVPGAGGRGGRDRERPRLREGDRGGGRDRSRDRQDRRSRSRDRDKRRSRSPEKGDKERAGSKRSRGEGGVRSQGPGAFGATPAKRHIRDGHRDGSRSRSPRRDGDDKRDRRDERGERRGHQRLGGRPGAGETNKDGKWWGEQDRSVRGRDQWPPGRRWNPHGGYTRGGEYPGGRVWRGDMRRGMGGYDHQGEPRGGRFGRARGALWTRDGPHAPQIGPMERGGYRQRGGGGWWFDRGGGEQWRHDQYELLERQQENGQGGEAKPRINLYAESFDKLNQFDSDLEEGEERPDPPTQGVKPIEPTESD
eukprot:GHVN01097114.1.p1 GENE.GHVN01097114.1~~GHVN01097114.1.p1  ORF type:complete len:866 (-),score=204.76 GHVN01097114.1:2354-4951(-)